MENSTLTRIYRETLTELHELSNAAGVPAIALISLATKVLAESKTIEEIREQSKTTLPGGVKPRRRTKTIGVAA